jgi:hypothetical protein
LEQKQESMRKTLEDNAQLTIELLTGIDKQNKEIAALKTEFENSKNHIE